MNNIVKAVFASPWTELLCRWGLGMVFVIASYQKGMYPAQFAKIIYGYQLVPGGVVNLLAILLPFIELYAGVALLSGVYVRSAALILNLLLLVFVVAISINLVRGHEFDCGCFSVGNVEAASAAALLLIRDLLLIVAGGYIMGFSSRRKGCFFPG